MLIWSLAVQAQGSPPSAANTEQPPPPQAAGAQREQDEGDSQPELRGTAFANSWLGSAGGLHLIDGSSGTPGSLRLQLGMSYFRASDFLVPGDVNEAMSGVLSVSATPIEHLEIFGALNSHSNSNTQGNPVLLQVAGDVTLGVKGSFAVTPWLDAGADLRALLLNTVGDVGVTFAATSVGLRFAGSADLRRTSLQFPLIVRANLGYLLDNSSKLIEGVENARYNALPAATRRDPANEDRQLITRVERFALGVNRLDMFSMGLGVEAPLRVVDGFYVNPLLEWQLGIPVNRQGYSCLSVPTSATISAPDGCLAVTGLEAAPSTLSIGARVYPFVPGLSALVAFDIGLLGTTHFVRELAPNAPWSLFLAVGYAFDTRKPKPEIRYVSAPQPPPPPAAAPVPTTTRVRGSVVEQGTGTPIVAAVVHYVGRSDLSPQLTDSDGHFTSYALPPGKVSLEITHPDYEPGQCELNVPQPTAAGAQSSGLAPAADSGAAPVEQRCELTAHPRNAAVSGTVKDEKGEPVAGVSIALSGASERTATTGAAGEFAFADLPPGAYTLRIDAPNYLYEVQSFAVAAGNAPALDVVVQSRPKFSQAMLTAHDIRLGTPIAFVSNTAEIDPHSFGVLREVADVLLRNPDKRVEVQAHTDNRGDSAQNQALSQKRAEAVVQWLVDAGVDRSRLEAKGYGDSRPIVPNLTPANRARNRRVEFVLIK